MSHSPDRRQPNARYDAAWDEINRKIRAGGSWSGHERNTFYLNGGRGRMFDLSAAMELDFPDDGRAFVRTDLDHDGDPDLVLKSRTAPQLRIVRNDLDILLPKRRGVVIRLIGTRGNREAVGAIVRAEVAQAGEIRWLTRSIGIGSGFLMQHSLEAFFGLGERGKIRTLTVTWPGGGETRLGTIEAGYRYTIEEGKGIVAAIPFRAPRTSPPAPLGSPSPRSGFALVSPYPAPPFTLPDLSGVRHTLPRKGRPLLLNFFATWCAPCKGEIADLERLSPLLASRGIETVLLSVDPLSEDFTPLPDETEVRKGVAAFVRSLGIDFPVLLADPDTAERYRLVSDGLCDHKRGLPLPLTLLIDEEGGIRKVYPGRFTFEEMRRDLETLDPWRNPSAAFPFPGRRVRYHFRRNDLWIGAAFARRDPQRFYADAKRAFERAITENPGVLPAWIDLATLELEAGHAQAARDTLVAARRRWPKEAEVAYRLGLACDRLGDTTAARRAYEAAIANDPTHARAHTNLG
ncbi:MAG: tetratricopeptide repeat protein, partial [Deltaproteobacteria bacterium]